MRLRRFKRVLKYGTALVACLAASAVAAAATDAPSVSDFMRPLAWSQVTVSPSGHYIAALVPDPDHANRRVLAVLNSTSGATIHVMQLPSPVAVANYAWAAHDRLVMTLAIVPDGGPPLPTGALAIADPDGGHAITLYGLDTRSPRRDDAHRRRLALPIDTGSAAREAILVTVNEPGSGGRDAAIERVDVSTAETHDLGTSPAPGARLIADRTGRVRAAYADQTATGAKLWLRKDDQSSWTLANDPAMSHVSIVPVGFARDNVHLYVRVSQRDGPHRIERMDTTSLRRELVYQAAFADPGDLRVTLKLNGDTMQDESTKDMLFGIARLVSYISQTARLLPGDLVLTGSPAGNGIHWGRLLRDGDVMDGSVTGLGAQRTHCVAEEAS